MTKSKATDSVSPFGDLSKMIEQFKLPGIDTAAIVESRRKDMEALMAANNAALETMQALAKKQVEIFTQAMNSAQENLQTLTKGGAMPDPVKQNELARDAFAKAMAQMSELADMARKAQSDAMADVGKRMAERGQEIRKAFQPK
ncbi:MAG: TIGR01841 family phasin [Proteobacteria bacterium]|nr:TIGR01841 family phasin [Pseudomonadota bacterium]MBS0493757.1 TIGR01841 family phasin [Pseudomonadota bacterium]